MHIVEKTTMPKLELRAKAHPEQLVCYAVHTCWWCILSDNPYSLPPDHQLPCDPRGSVLMQGELGKFLEAAKANPDHYGKHGLKAFMAAYHGNLLTDDGRPTSLERWAKYNEILDTQEVQEARQA